jgi:hypothetical protein
MPRRLSFRLASLLFACGLVARVHAAELGDVKVSSFVGQQLSADIELTALDDPAAPVKVRLASLDVYRGANLDMPAVLASLNLSVARRDGRQFLHVTSTRPVDADHLHLYLELTDGNRKGVRLATLWFAPDPTPPAPPERVAIPMTAPAAAAAPASRRKGALVQPLPQSSLPVAKARATPVAPLVRAASEAEAQTQKADPADAKPGPATTEQTPAKPTATTEQAPAKPTVSTQHAPAKPDATAARETSIKAPAASEPAPANQAATQDATGPRKPKASTQAPAQAAVPPLPWASGQPARPAPLKLAKAPAAPVCRTQPSQAESTCVVLDSKNAELRAEIGRLEARVNSLLAQENSRQPEESKPSAPSGAKLQEARPAATTSPQPVAAPSQSAAGQIKPATAHRAKLTKGAPQPIPVAHKAEEPAGMPWGWLAAAGAAVFAAIGGLQFWRHRRKRPKSMTVHAPLPDDEEGQVEPTLG